MTAKKTKAKSILTACAICGGLASFAWFNSLPHAGNAAVSSSDVMYGIHTSTGSLQRFDFATHVLTTVGTIEDASATALTGIEASAYIPGFANIYGFWQDPADGLSKLVYINATTAKASVVGFDLGEELVTGATTAFDGTNYRVYAVTSPNVVDFAVADDSVIPSETYATKFTVLGTTLTDAGLYDMPITMRLTVGSNTYDPFGALSSPVGGTVNDAANPRMFLLATTSPAFDAISVAAHTWLLNAGQDGDLDSEWTSDMTVDSSVATPQVLVLRNGDSIPAVPALNDPSLLLGYIADYVNITAGKMVMGANQAIYLFELGTTDLTSAAADFQDLAVLVTLATDTAILTDASVTGATISGDIAINPNNSPDSTFTLVKPDTTEITRDDLNKHAVIDASGTYYEGDATRITVNPKSPKKQTSLIVDGVAYEMKPDTTYTITASGMTARVYNDTGDTKNSGHWRVEINVGTPVAKIKEGSYAPPAARLIEVDNTTAVTTHIMDLDRSYGSLASSDGAMFYGFSGTGIYAIDALAATETLVGTIPASQVNGLEYTALGDLHGYDVVTDQLAPLDPTGGTLVGTAAALGTMTDLGTIIFTTTDKDPKDFDIFYD